MTKESRGDVVLSVENLTVSLKGEAGVPGTALVRDISLSVRAGETLCIVGESGSGKSVSSLAIMGLLDDGSIEVSQGRIVVDGVDILTASPEELRRMRASRMSMIFQEPMSALNPVETVGAQVEEVLRVHGERSATRRRQRVLAMFEAVNLPEPQRIYASYPHQLSGGQRQRIVISMALILDPKLLIADEPTTALDVTTQKQILVLLDELQARFNTAVLFITHDFGVVSEIADRIVVMKRGAVVEIGECENILARPREDYTRMLVSSVPSLIPREKAIPSGATVLDVRRMTKSYAVGNFLSRRKVAALKPADLTLSKGEIVGIVGESGSGKTTLARCLSRLIEPTSGVVELMGVDISKLGESSLRPHRRHLQVVFQDPMRSLNSRRQVRDLVSEGLLNYGIPRREAYRRAGDLLERVGLERAMLDRFAHQFSGGQRQRICIARALALEPSVLIADEAVSALDVSVQRQVLDLLESIRTERHIAIVFITHDLRVAAEICDRIIVMQHGCAVEAGTAFQVLTHPVDSYTRSLIDAAPGRDWDFRGFRPFEGAARSKTPPVPRTER